MNPDRITEALQRAQAQAAAPANEAPQEPEVFRPSPGPDRITEALERAHAQAANAGSSPSANVFRASAAPLAPIVHKAEFVRSGPGRAPIVYTQTRVAEASREDLIRMRVAVEGADPELINAIKLIRTQVVQKMRDRGWRTLAVVSPNEGEGKTLMAVNLAISIAAEFDQTALLVDANLRDPDMHRYFGLPAEPGLSDYLMQQVTIDAILVNPGIERLVVMPAGSPQVSSAELLGSTQMGLLMTDLKSRYADRIIVIDLPPVLRSADALTFAPQADAILMVVEDNHSRRDEILQAQHLLAGTNLIGVVLNKARTESDEASKKRRRDEVSAVGNRGA
jgi:protein-tyrosine kinase